MSRTSQKISDVYPQSGTGDMHGPSSAAENNLVAFDGTTGKYVKDSGVSPANFDAAGAAASAQAAAALDAMAKANAAEVAAIAASAEDATVKAEAAQANAIAAAAIDATSKANVAYSGAIAFSAIDASSKANMAYSGAIAYSALDASSKANIAYSGAVATAALDASSKANMAYSGAVAVASLDASTKATAAQSAAEAASDPLGSAADAYSAAVAASDPLGTADSVVATHNALSTAHGQTTFSNSLVTAANAASARTSLGLGNSATLNMSVANGVAALDVNTRLNANQVPRGLLATGLIGGGEITINGADNTKFDIASGLGRIVDNHTDPTNPVVTLVTWPAMPSLTPEFIATDTTSYIAIDVTGAVKQWGDNYYTPVETRQYIILGWVEHINHAIIDFAFTQPFWFPDTSLSLQDFFGAFGAFNVWGNGYSDSASALKVKKTSGQMFDASGDYPTDRATPNLVASNAEDPITYYPFWRTAPGTWYNVAPPVQTIDPNHYDNGSGLVSVPSNKWTIQVISHYAAMDSHDIQYGQKLYDDLASATAGIADAIEINPYLAFDVVRCWLLIKQGTTNWTDPTRFQFVTAGRFGLNGGGGGSGGGGSGEANTASNFGTAGTGFYDSKLGVDLRFKNLHGNGSLTTAANAATHTVELFLSSIIENHPARTDNPHATTYTQIGAASAANGVTGGNSHTHVSGDGAKITESALSFSDITTSNANIVQHGLMPKLGGNVNQVFHGDGSQAGVAEAALAFTDITISNANTVQHGLMPKLDGTATHIFHSDGMQKQLVEADMNLTDVTSKNASTSAHGFLPKLSGNVTQVLRGDGTFGQAVTGASFYLSDVLIGVGGYYTYALTPDSPPEVIDTAVIINTAGEVALASYCSAPLGIAAWDAGLFVSNIYAAVSASTGTTNIICRLYRRTQAGVETLIGTFATADINAIAPNPVLYAVSQTLTASSGALSDRLVAKYVAKTTAAVSITVSMYHNDPTRNTYMATPINLSVAIQGIFADKVAAAALSGQRMVVTDTLGQVNYASSANLAHASAVFGMTSGAVILGDVAHVVVNGEWEDPGWSWTPEDKLWLNGTSGQIQNTPPATGHSTVIGFALTATRIMVQPKLGIILA